VTRGTVMSLQRNTAVVLTPDGQFIRVRRQSWFEIGEEIAGEALVRAASRIRRRLLQAGALASAIALILFAATMFGTRPVVAYVTMDVNPSIELGLDAGEKVRELRAVNEDGKELVEGVKYRGRDLETVVNELARKLVETRVLTPDDGEVVIASVPVKDVDEQWERQVTRKMARILNEATKSEQENRSVKLDVTTVSVPKEVRKEAEANGISSGKMAFWLASESQGHDVSLETLKKESMKDIAAEWGGIKQVMEQYERKPSDNPRDGKNGDSKNQKDKDDKRDKDDKKDKSGKKDKSDKKEKKDNKGKRDKNDKQDQNDNRANKNNEKASLKNGNKPNYGSQDEAEKHAEGKYRQDRGDRTEQGRNRNDSLNRPGNPDKNKTNGKESKRENDKNSGTNQEKNKGKDGKNNEKNNEKNNGKNKNNNSGNGRGQR